MIWGEAPEIFCRRLLAFFYCLLERGLSAAAHKAVFFRKEMRWCGKRLYGQTVRHDPENTEGLSELCRPETAGELMQFFQAINWMRTSVPQPQVAELEPPLLARSKSVCASHTSPSVWGRAVLLAATSKRTNAWPRGMLCDCG